MLVNLQMGFDDLAESAASPSNDESPLSKAYRHLADLPVRFRYRQDNSSGLRSYRLWSMFFEAKIIQDVIDFRNDLNAEYPEQLRTEGAWWFDSREVGTEWELDQNGERVFYIEQDDKGKDVIVWHTTGQPIFRVQANRYIEYIPNIITWDNDGNVVSNIRPTELTDVNLLQGQEERRFE